MHSQHSTQVKGGDGMECKNRLTRRISNGMKLLPSHEVEVTKKDNAERISENENLMLFKEGVFKIRLSVHISKGYFCLPFSERWKTPEQTFF